MCSEGRKPCSESAWFCLICVCFFAMVDRRGEDKTSFWIGLILRDFCYLIAVVVSCYLIVACRIILIVVPGCCICCFVIVWYGGVACCIVIVVPGYWYGGDWFSLSLSCVAKGENLVRTCLDFPWFVAFFAMVLLDFMYSEMAKTSLRLCLTLLDFRHCAAYVSLDVMRGRRTDPCFDFAWLCFIFCIFAI